MNRSYSKKRHIQEANERLENRIISEKNWIQKLYHEFSGGDRKEDIPFDGGGEKYNEIGQKLHDFEKNDPYTDVKFREFRNKPHNVRNYVIKKVDDCSDNKVSFDPGNKMVIVSYCNYDGEKFVEELDEKGDDMWFEIKKEAEDKSNRGPIR